MLNVTGDIRYAVTEPINEGPVFVHCPFHDDNKPSMAVYPDGSWCFVCNKGEKPEEFLERVEHEGELPAYNQESFKRNEVVAGDVSNNLRIRAYTWYWTLMFGRRRQRLSWLADDRGLRYQTIREHMLGHNGFAFSIPVFRDGEIIGLKYRIDPLYDFNEMPKYWNTRGLPTSLFTSGEDHRPVWVCEGEFDAMLLGQYGVYAVTSTGGSGKLAQDVPDVETSYKVIYIATDDDEAGDQAFRKLRRLLEQKGKRPLRVDLEGHNDVSDWLLSYPESRRQEVVRQAMHKAKEDL